jgi:hypothetical protein
MGGTTQRGCVWCVGCMLYIDVVSSTVDRFYANVISES